MITAYTLYDTTEHMQVIVFTFNDRTAYKLNLVLLKISRRKVLSGLGKIFFGNYLQTSKSTKIFTDNLCCTRWFYKNMTNIAEMEFEDGKISKFSRNVPK